MHRLRLRQSKRPPTAAAGQPTFNRASPEQHEPASARPAEGNTHARWLAPNGPPTQPPRRRQFRRFPQGTRLCIDLNWRGIPCWLERR